MPTLFRSLGLLVMLSCCAVHVWGQAEVTVEVTGHGVSASAALADAQRKAVEQGAGVFLQSKSRTENFVLIEDQIYSESNGFISGFQELSKSQDRSGIWAVTIRATVSTQVIEAKFAQYELLMKRVGRPKIMTVIKTVRDSREIESQEVVIGIEQPLVDALFTLIDKQAFDAAKQQALAAANLNDDVNAMARIGKEAGADLIIRGLVMAQSNVKESYPGEPPYVSISWNFQYRIIRTNDSSILAVHNANSKTFPNPRVGAESPDDVFARGADVEGRKTGRETRAKLMAKWAFEAQNRMIINVEIHNSEFDDGNVLVEWIKAQDWASDAYMDDFTDSVTKLRIDSKLPQARDLAAALSRGAGCPIKLKVTGLKQGTITCTVAGR